MSTERLEMDRETANESLAPAPRDLLWPKRQPPTPQQRAYTTALRLAAEMTNPDTITGRAAIARLIKAAHNLTAQSARQVATRAIQELSKGLDRDTALPAERERAHPLGLFRR